jgi:hypothetical protein
LSAVLAEQLAHLVDGHLLPVVDQLTGKAELVLVVGLGHEGAVAEHGIGLQDRDFQVRSELR